MLPKVDADPFERMSDADLYTYRQWVAWHIWNRQGQLAVAEHRAILDHIRHHLRPPVDMTTRIPLELLGARMAELRKAATADTVDLSGLPLGRLASLAALAGLAGAALYFGLPAHLVAPLAAQLGGEIIMSNWEAFIPLATPIIVMLVRKGLALVLPKIPRTFSPLLAAVIGAAAAAVGDVNLAVGAGLGLGGVGVVEAGRSARKDSADGGKSSDSV